MNISSSLFNKITKYDSIVVFGHIDPDGDCAGSVLGLKHILKDNFPSKNIYAIGNFPKSLPRFVEKSDIVDDQIIASSLGILTDLSGIHRAEDQRVKLCKEIIVIDHHIPSEEDKKLIAYRIIDAASATYVIYKFCEELNLSISTLAANYLYMGLITDTDRFLLDSNEDTLFTAKKLIALGADYINIYKDLYTPSEAKLKFRAFVYQNYQFSKNCCYLIIHKENYLSLGLNQNDIANEVSLIANLGNKPCWVFFVEKEDHKIRTEYRSDNIFNVEKIARHFLGGGHYNASGCLLESLDKVKEVIEYIDSQN